MRTLLAGFFLALLIPALSAAAELERVEFKLPQGRGFYTPARLFPGRALVLVLTGSRAAEPAPDFQKMHFLGKSFRLEKVESGRRGVVVIPLGTSAGSYPLVLGVEGASEFALNLQILEHDYGEQRLTVASEMAQPTKPANLARIKHDRQILKRVYAQSSPLLQLSGQLKAPLQATITSPFGRRRYLNDIPRSPHGGIDYQAAVGEPVPAAGRGRVVLAEELYYSGKLVLIDHGLEIFSLYMHLDEFNCRVGDLVETGQIVGRSGCSGRVTGPHLHWGIKIAGMFVDPLQFAETSKNLLESSW